uniref:Uncharacterized protein n=1 Tax=Plectus sambesii TaxID=2011161 RepID=A0A914X6P9_9BILA
MGEVFLNQMKKLSNCSEKPQNKDLQKREIILEGCIMMGKACFNQMKKLSNEKPQNKGIQERKITWEICIKKGKACLNRMKKLSNGTQKLQNKGI